MPDGRCALEPNEKLGREGKEILLVKTIAFAIYSEKTFLSLAAKELHRRINK